MERRMRVIEEAMAQGSASDEDYESYGDLQEKAEFYGLYEYERRIERTLEGLGFSKSDWEKPIHILSGGQKTRALLAKLLLEMPDLLILDEPTNHLDMDAVRWLEGTLYAWNGAVLIVSHDRYFLDRVVNRIWEMTRIRIDEYRGNYSAYLQQRQQKRERTQIEWDAMMERFWKEYKYIERMGLGDTNAKGRFRRLTREVEAIGRHGIDALRFIRNEGWMEYTARFDRKRPPDTMKELESAINALKSPIQKQRSMRLRLEAQERSGDIVLRGRHLTIGYEKDAPLFSSDDIDLMRGDIAALIGPNGTGKTTFLRTLLKQLEPLKGHVTFGAGLQIGYFAQAHDALDHSRTVIEELMRHRTGMGIAAARHYLAPYLFTGENVNKLVSALSGGERGRLALAILALKGSNLLLLDEPTNHLDIPAQEVLEDVLQEYTGTIILVTHDRYLVDRLANQIWELRDGALRVFKGSYQEYIETLDVESAEAVAAAPVRKPEPVQPAVDPKVIARLEAQIGTLEAELRELETLLARASAAGNGDTIQMLSKQYSTQQKRLAELMHEWEVLSEKVQASPSR
jgi:ATP-binding cassette subfamily F protein 3